MSVHEAAVTRYFTAWNAEGSEDVAKAGAATAWSKDGGPGFAFRQTGTVDGHHGVARFGWELVSAADGSAPVAGSDVIALADDGRIRTVHGFLDRVPAA
ncbi:nuclear transport factor 2 family protein [Streptomyces sp. NPDC051320]|uniref:nuclear transport factor 2 family protein n=1 Tax=Streptomyces sp. NPDC051320 TaxID=3154644 RepID=UPI0034245157